MSIIADNDENVFFDDGDDGSGEDQISMEDYDDETSPEQQRAITEAERTRTITNAFERQLTYMTNALQATNSLIGLVVNQVDQGAIMGSGKDDESFQLFVDLKNNSEQINQQLTAIQAAQGDLNMLTSMGKVDPDKIPESAELYTSLSNDLIINTISNSQKLLRARQDKSDPILNQYLKRDVESIVDFDQKMQSQIAKIWAYDTQLDNLLRLTAKDLIEEEQPTLRIPKTEPPQIMLTADMKTKRAKIDYRFPRNNIDKQLELYKQQYIDNLSANEFYFDNQNLISLPQDQAEIRGQIKWEQFAEAFENEQEPEKYFMTVKETWDQVYLPVIDMIDMYTKGVTIKSGLSSIVPDQFDQSSMTVNAGFFSDAYFIKDIPERARDVTIDKVSKYSPGLADLSERDYQDGVLRAMGEFFVEVAKNEKKEHGLAVITPSRYVGQNASQNSFMQGLVDKNVLATPNGQTAMLSLLQDLNQEIRVRKSHQNTPSRVLNDTQLSEQIIIMGLDNKSILGTAETIEDVLKLLRLRYLGYDQGSLSNGVIQDAIESDFQTFKSQWEVQLINNLSKVNYQQTDPTNLVARIFPMTQIKTTNDRNQVDPLQIIKQQNRSTILGTYVQSLKDDIDTMNQQVAEILKHSQPTFAPPGLAQDMNDDGNIEAQQIDTFTAQAGIVCQLCGTGGDDQNMQKTNCCNAIVHTNCFQIGCIATTDIMCPACQQRDIKLLTTRPLDQQPPHQNVQGDVNQMNTDRQNNQDQQIFQQTQTFDNLSFVQTNQAQTAPQMSAFDDFSSIQQLNLSAGAGLSNIVQDAISDAQSDFRLSNSQFDPQQIPLQGVNLFATTQSDRVPEIERLNLSRQISAYNSEQAINAVDTFAQKRKDTALSKIVKQARYQQNVRTKAITRRKTKQQLRSIPEEEEKEDNLDDDNLSSISSVSLGSGLTQIEGIQQAQQLQQQDQNLQNIQSNLSSVANQLQQQAAGRFVVGKTSQKLISDLESVIQQVDDNFVEKQQLKDQLQKFKENPDSNTSDISVKAIQLTKSIENENNLVRKRLTEIRNKVLKITEKNADRESLGTVFKQVVADMDGALTTIGLPQFTSSNLNGGNNSIDNIQEVIDWYRKAQVQEEKVITEAKTNTRELDSLFDQQKRVSKEYTNIQRKLTSQAIRLIRDIKNAPPDINLLDNNQKLQLTTTLQDIEQNRRGIGISDLAQLSTYAELTIDKFNDQSEKKKDFISKVADFKNELKQQNSKFTDLRTQAITLDSKIRRLDTQLVNNKVYTNSRFQNQSEITLQDLASLADDLQQYSQTTEASLRLRNKELATIKNLGEDLLKDRNKLETVNDQRQEAIDKTLRKLRTIDYQQKTIYQASQDPVQYLQAEITKIEQTKQDVDKDVKQLQDELAVLQSKNRQLEEERTELKLMSKRKEKQLAIGNESMVQVAIQRAAVTALNSKFDDLQKLKRMRTADIKKHLEDNLKVDKTFTDILDGDLNVLQNTIDAAVNQNFDPLKSDFLQSTIARNLPKFFQDTLQQAAEAITIQTDVLQKPGRNMFAATTNLLTGLYEKISEYAVVEQIVPQDKQDEKNQQLQKQIETIMKVMIENGNQIRKLSQLDIQHLTLMARGGQYAKRSIAQLENSYGSQNIISKLNEMESITDQYVQHIRSSSSVNLGETSTYMTNVSRVASQISKQLETIEEKSIRLRMKSQVQQKATDIANTLVRTTLSNQQVAAAQQRIPRIANGDAMKYLGQVMTDMYEEVALSYIAGGRPVQGMQSRLEQILSQNKILQDGDVQMAAARLKDFIQDSTQEFQQQFAERLANITSRQFAGVYQKIDGITVKQLLENRGSANNFIQQRFMFRDLTDEEKNDIKNALPQIEELKQFQNAVREDINKIKQRGGYARAAIVFPNTQETVNRAILNRTGQLSGQVYINDDNPTGKITLLQLAQKQKEIYATPKEQLQEQKQSVATDKRKWMDVYNSFGINPALHQNDLKKQTAMMLRYIATTGMANTTRGVQFPNYSAANFPDDDPFAALSPQQQLAMSVDFLMNQEQLTVQILAPYKLQMQTGIMPQREDIIALRAYENIIQFMKQSYLNLAPQRQQIFRGQQLSQTQSAAIGAVTGNLWGPQQLNAIQLADEFSQYVQHVASDVKDYGQEYIRKNIEFLDKVDSAIDERRRGDSKLEKQEKVNERIEKYSQGLQDHLQMMLTKQGLKAFFNGDQQSQQFAQKAQQQMLPRYYPTSFPQSQSGQQSGLMSNNQNNQFMAFSGSEAAVSGDPSKGRLNQQALSAAQDQISNITDADLGFLRNIYFDETQKKLLFKDQTTQGQGQGRELTREEKRRYVKLLVTILVFLYITQVKKLSQQKKRSAEEKLMAKYASKNDPQPLIEMINKLAVKAVQVNGPGNSIGKPRANQEQRQATQDNEDNEQQ